MKRESIFYAPKSKWQLTVQCVSRVIRVRNALLERLLPQRCISDLQSTVGQSVSLLPRTFRTD